VQSLVDTIETMGNIFSDESGDLLVLDSREIMPDCVKKTVACMKEAGLK